MTELEYVLSCFEERFAAFRGMRIILHGSRAYAEQIIERFYGIFQFVGVMTRDPLPSSEFHGLPVFPESEIPALEPELIILTERVKYAEAVYQDLHEICEQEGILLFNMYGVDELRAHRELERFDPINIYGWEKLCGPYQIVMFETVGGLFDEPENTGGALILRKHFYKLILWLLDRGTDVRFSLRKSFPEETQLQALYDLGIIPDPESRVIRREGEDLSFRKLREENPEKKILYIGLGLVNECLLPRCYGIDTHRPFADGEFGFFDSNAPVGPNSAGPVRAASILKDDILGQIREHEIISFDIFDTLLIRKTLFPEDVFDLVSMRLEMHHIPAADFAENRVKAGREIPYAGLEEIYTRLAEIYGWDAGTAASVRDLEIETESEVIRPRDEIVSLLNSALSLGKRVVLTSDMYLPSRVLKDLLEKNGVSGWERILVSCEQRSSKRDGLFAVLCEMRAGNESILHIGDDLEADERPCRPYGIDPVILPSVRNLAGSRGWKESIAMAESLPDRCLLGMTLAAIFRDPFQKVDLRDLSEENRLLRYARSVIGPICVAYAGWLITRFRRVKYDAVLFLSRDGWLFSRIYEALGRRFDLPRAVYLRLNRHAAFLCCADDPQLIHFAEEMAAMDHLSGPDVLSRVYNLPIGEQLPEADGECLRNLILRHMPLIREKTEEARADLAKYWEKCGLSPDGSYAVVDFIAKGTTLQFLERVLPCRIKGFCFANYDLDFQRDYTIEDYLLTKKKLLLHNYIELESYVTSPEPSVNHLDANGDVVFSEEVRSPEDLRALQLVLEESEKFSLEFFSLFPDRFGLIAPDLIDEMFAAEGCHWVQRFAWNDWSNSPIPTKPWQTETGI